MSDQYSRYDHRKTKTVTYRVHGYMGIVSEHDNLSEARVACALEREEHGVGMITKHISECIHLDSYEHVQGRL